MTKKKTENLRQKRRKKVFPKIIFEIINNAIKLPDTNAK